MSLDCKENIDLCTQSIKHQESEMLKIIALESKHANEFARRAEAWNSANAKPLTDRVLVKAYLSTYQRVTDLQQRAAMRNLEQLVRMARERRLAGNQKLWNNLITNVDKEI